MVEEVLAEEEVEVEAKEEVIAQYYTCHISKPYLKLLLQ